MQLFSTHIKSHKGTFVGHPVVDLPLVCLYKGRRSHGNPSNKYEDLENMKADCANTSIINLHQINKKNFLRTTGNRLAT